VAQQTRTAAREPLPAPQPTVAALIRHRVATTPDDQAYTFPTADGTGSLTWRETDQRVRRIAAGLISLGLGIEDRVGIASSTRIEWVLADFAVMLAGGATTTVYPSTGEEDVAYILSDSGTRVIFAEDDEQVAKLVASRDRLPDLMRVVTFDGTPDGDWVMSLADLEVLGAEQLAADPGCVDARSDALTPQHLATLIYTSGTTGRPKGVELLHSCWTYEGAAVDGTGILSGADLQYLWLPLSHSFGKVLLAVQLQIGFPTYVDGRIDQIVPNIGAIKPTFMAGAPRVFEKIYGRVNTMQQQEGGAKLAIYNWAIGVGERVASAKAAGRSPSAVDGIAHGLADRLVFSKVRARMGGRIRYFVSGSAALSGDVARWFDAVGMPILEGYGLTETSAASCMIRPDSIGYGTVGEPFPGTEVAIAEDGEILIKGPGVMRGYRNMAEQTAEVLPEGPDGWFATGDIGEIDPTGRVRITDRKKDLFKTSGGKYIAPQAIESQFKAVCPIASQMVVLARNYAAALISVDEEAVMGWASSNGVAGDLAAVTASPQLRGYLQECVDQLNGSLNRWETIKEFRILPDDLTVEAGELTPSLKVKRKVVEERNAALIAEMFSAGGAAG
jgi:long-chain acyl-CoA synthetase